MITLDEDVIISCDDLHFSLTVWQSSQNSVVGFYPRLYREKVSKKDTKNEVSYEFLNSWMFVWYHQYYSLILPAGSIINKHYIQVFIFYCYSCFHFITLFIVICIIHYTCYT